MNPNHADLYPMNPLFFEMNFVYELNLDHWLSLANHSGMLSDQGGPLDQRYAYTKVRQARDKRIEIILERRGIEKMSSDYWRYFHGYVTDVQRLDWEKKSGLTAILPN